MSHRLDLLFLREGEGRVEVTCNGDGHCVGSCSWWVPNCDAADGEDDGEYDEDDLCDVDAIFPGFVEGEDG